MFYNSSTYTCLSSYSRRNGGISHEHSGFCLSELYQSYWSMSLAIKMKFLNTEDPQSELPRWIPWNQTSDVHRWSSLITWRWRYITWRWHHRNHTNTKISVIVANKIHKLHLFCWLYFSGNQENGFAIGLDPHAPELISFRQFRLKNRAFS